MKLEKAVEAHATRLRASQKDEEDESAEEEQALLATLEAQIKEWKTKKADNLMQVGGEMPECQASSHAEIVEDNS